MYSIGIDFGTTKTLVSYFDHDTKNHGYVRLGRSTDKMPTTIYVGEDGSWQFGDDADDFMSEAPARYCRDFKLGLGKKTPCLTVKIGGKLQKFTAKDLTARFLENVRIQCERLVFHAPVRSCAVTYPVAFSIAQRSELENAAKEAGFDEVHLLPEPESAGYAYFRFGVDKNLSRLMVVDWGGGTVDFAMIICKGQEVSIVPESYGGVINYGGRLFDERLFARLSLKISQSGGGSLEDDVDPMLVKRVSECKEKLSRMTSIKSLMLVSRTNVYRTEVSREEFNALIASDVDRVVDQLQALIAQCAEKPQALLLIGGSSSVPFVRERLQQLTGLRCVEWDKLNEAVALGSAWYGSKVCRSEDDASDQLGNCVSAPSSVASVSQPSARCWRNGDALERYIQQERILHEDWWYFYRAVFILFWRMNTIQTSALALSSELEQIGENDDAKLIVIKVRQGLNAIAIDEFGAMVEAVSGAISGLFGDAFDDINKHWVKLHPELLPIAQKLQAVTVDKIAFKKEVSDSLGQLKSDYDDVYTKYRQLCEGFARYDKIMTRSPLWKLAAGAMLGILTGGIGVAAAVAWDSWSHMSDKDFVQNYANAVWEFIGVCDAFTGKGCALIEKLVTTKQDLWNRAFSQKEAFMRALNAEGVDLEALSRQIDALEGNENSGQRNTEIHQWMSVAFDYMKEEALIPLKRIKKIVDVCRRQGWLLLSDGTLDEAAVQALEPSDSIDDDTVNRFLQIVRSCQQFYGDFYVMEGIPGDKLVNALHDYGCGLSAENVLCLYDSTVFGGGGDGFMIVAGGVCWKQLGCNPQLCTWDEMRTISTRDGCSNCVLINGVEMDVPYGGAGAFADMFRALQAFFCEGKMNEESDVRYESQPLPYAGEEVLNGLLGKRVKEIIVEQLGVNPEQVTAEASFIDDLGADPLDSVELIMAVEEGIGAAIPEEDAEKLTTVGKVVEYLKSKGYE